MQVEKYRIDSDGGKCSKVIKYAFVYNLNADMVGLRLIDAEKGPKSSNLRFRPQMDSQSFDFSRYPKIEEVFL